jgi:hypothetical protein
VVDYPVYTDGNLSIIQWKFQFCDQFLWIHVSIHFQIFSRDVCDDSMVGFQEDSLCSTSSSSFAEKF